MENRFGIRATFPYLWGMGQSDFHTPRIRSALICTAVCVCLTANSGDNAFAGKDGRGIAGEIAASCRPQRYASSEAEIRETAASYARNADGNWRDYFAQTAVQSWSDLSMQHIVPAEWWGGSSQSAIIDMHNIVPANREAAYARLDYPPGIVTDTDYDNGYWRAGTGTLAGIEAGFFEPADELKGDFARVFMYMAIVHSCELWHGRAPMIYVDGGYPYLNAYGRETLMKWHRDDPVDEAELRRDRAIAAFQGCGNPFVTGPDLAEYVWGTRSGDIYPGADPDEGDDPKEDDGQVAELRGVYSLASDSEIGLRSPYVGSEASWTFDGRAVEGQVVSLDGVKAGKHELIYRSPSASGRIIITVTP